MAKLGDLKHNKMAKWPTYAVMYKLLVVKFSGADGGT